MDQSPNSLPATDLLLAHTEFLSALSARLVSGGADADDLAQETWLSALRHPPADAGAVRAWLAKVARNHALQAHRTRRRRAAREQWVARPEGLPSTDEIVARENARRGVVDSLHRLSEPYRSTLLLRFYEDLPPREVARRMNVPVETARTRIKRGLALLRDELDRRNGGDRGAWMSALMPLALGELTAPSAGASATFGPLTLPFGLLAMLVAALWWGQRQRSDPDPSAARPAAQLAAQNMTEVRSAPAVRAEAALSEARRFYAVRVVYDDDGAAAAGLVVSAQPLAGESKAQTWTSDVDGLAPQEVGLAPGDRVSVAPSLSARSTERTLDADALAGEALEVRVQRASSVRGRVTDDRSMPVAGALVWAALPSAAHLDQGEPREPLARCLTDVAGEFTLLELPERFYVHASDTGRTLARGAHIQGRQHRAHEGLELRLERSWNLSGRVVDGQGAALEGVVIATTTHDLRGPGRAASAADVSWRNLLRGTWTSDSNGRFELRGLAPIAHNLALSLEGYILVERRITEPGWNELVVLERAAQIQIELRDDAGAALEGEVSLLGENGGASRSTTAGGRAVLNVRRDESTLLLCARASGFATVAQALALDGRAHVTEVVRMTPERRVSVRVTDLRGAPIAGASAVASPNGALPAGFEPAVSDDELAEFRVLGGAISDADGRVELRGLPHAELELRVEAPAFTSVVVQQPPGLDELVVALAGAVVERTRLRLDARESLSGAAVVGCVVTARTDTPAGALSLDLRIDGEGELELPQNGLWSLYARAPGHAPSIRRWREGDDTLVRFELAPERSLHVRARDLRGAPIHPARLIVTDESGVPLPTAISPTYWANYIEMPEDGELLVRGLPAARVRVSIRSAQIEGVEPTLVDLRDEREAQLLLELPADLSSPRARLELDWPAGFVAEHVPVRERGARSRRNDGPRLLVWDSSGALCGRHRVESDPAGSVSFAHPWTMMSLRFDENGVCEAASQQRLEVDALFGDFGPRVDADNGRVSLLVPASGGRVALQIAGEDVLAATFAPPFDAPVRLSLVGR